MNKKHKIYKTVFIICVVIAVIVFFLGIFTSIGNGKTKSPGLATMGYSFIFSSAILVATISLAKANNQIPIVFKPDKYKYYPDDKKKLSLDETMYYMHDKTVIKVFYGVFLFIWGIVFICGEVGLFVIEGATIVEAVVINVVLFAVLLLVSGVFGFMLYVTKRNGAKYSLDTNSRKYADIVTKDFLGVVEQDLCKGMRFRSPKLILTEQFILGSLNKVSLAPVAIPVNQVKKIRYDTHYFQSSSGGGYMEVKLYFELSNKKTVLLYLDYKKWEIVIQMFQYYGFHI